ncbi:uncharacterized protein F4807DRAFT_163389 [Annulohypoxylon truncatum]|uniref:uncharacterized protein n=1 Tax=Annulohypoxylon truncatum TaxID=327061 RepID=UPI002007C098|nr:uncharacterized protein F4807DRAFT_163389 [Annulohypoxylon truncatum]KAI1208048.1 hypothetical protein F4807DRAFT_163389 [Annulohypoxylon truncatum]
MRGYLKAQLLLAPLLAAALPTRHETNAPHALINLDVNNSEDDATLQGPTLRLNIHESTSPCGYGNVTLNDQTLAQDENGAGSGSITTEQGNAVLAKWGFTCVHLEDEFQGQLMTFEVISVDDRKVDDVGFVVQFQQMVPVSVSLINGTGSTVNVPVPSENINDNDSSNKESSATLDGELAELKSMMRQLAALEYAISSKIHHISDTYDFKVKRPGHFHSLSDCDSLKCVVKTMYVRAKHVASKLYGHGFEGEGPFGGKPHRHHWPFHHQEGHHGHRPHWMMSHHHENGNHSHPFPPHHPPHGPPHGPPPHGPPPHGPHGEPPFHHPPPPPPPSPFWGEHPPHGGPPGPPGHHEFEDKPHHEHHGPDAGFHKEMVSWD